MLSIEKAEDLILSSTMHVEAIKHANAYQLLAKNKSLAHLSRMRTASQMIVFKKDIDSALAIEKMTELSKRIENKLQHISEWNTLDEKITNKCIKFIRRATATGFGNGIFSDFLKQYIHNGYLTKAQLNICMRGLAISYGKKARNDYFDKSNDFWFLDTGTYKKITIITDADELCSRRLFSKDRGVPVSFIISSKRLYNNKAAITNAGESIAATISGSGRMRGVFSVAPYYALENTKVIFEAAHEV